MKNISLIGASFGWGAQIRETEDGPVHLKLSDSFVDLLDKPNVGWITTLQPKKSYREHELAVGKETLPFLESFCKDLSATVAREVEHDNIPVVLGGDHSIAIGTWSGVADEKNIRGALGLIWFDAHMDAHTPETSPSHAYHGMPVATLLGYGEDGLRGNSPAVRPENVVLIGIRSYEDGERNLLERLGVKIYTPADVQEKGFDVVLKEAIEIASTKLEALVLVWI